MTADEKKALERLERACDALTEALTDLRGTVEVVRAHRSSGRPLVEVYQREELRTVRDRVYARLAAFEAAFTNARATAVRQMVDNEHLTFTDVARLTRRSRQFITRLYRLPADTERAESDA